jgi:ribosomal protein S6--L-glutamate ligase
VNIGVMTVNGWEFHPNARFRKEADTRGHQITLINPYDMGCILGEAGADIFFDQGRLPDHLLDLVMPRQGSPMGEYGFVLLNHFSCLGIPLVNRIQGVAIARNQFLTLQALAGAGLPVPETCFAVSREAVMGAIQRLGGYPVVAKQVDGMGGEGVVKLHDRDEADALLARQFIPQKGLVIQAYIPSSGRRDIRMLVIGGQVAGAVTLTPRPGEFKSNLHQQGRPCAFTPDPALARMAVTAAKACALEIAGVDMMTDARGRVMVHEVNYSPGFRGMEAATGLNIAGDILDHALGQCLEKRKVNK